MGERRIWVLGLYGRLAKVFPEFEEWMRREILEVKKFLKKNSLVLDMGCGWGREMKELAPFCRKIAGIDNSPREIEDAKSYLKGIRNMELFVEDARKTHFPNESFDFIIALGNTFGNLGREKDSILSEMKRLVKKGGKILISVYSKGSSYRRAENYRRAGMNVKRVGKGKIIFGGGLVSEEFSKEELKSIFEKFGLETRFIDIGSIGILCVISK